MTPSFTRNRSRVASMRKMVTNRDPAIAGMLDEELDRAIERAAIAFHASPRSGLRKWLAALTREKDRRRSRRG